MSKITFRPEIQVLLGCARTELDAVTIERLNMLLRQDLDWPYLVEKAEWHGVMPLLYHNLSRTFPEAVPPPVLKQLETRFQENAGRNVAFTRELLRLIRLLEAQGVQAVPYKGPALAVAAYGDLALRRFSDLDIVVQRDDALRVKDILIAEGYHPKAELAKAQELALLKSSYNYSFVSSDGKIMVEVHWAFVERFFSFRIDANRVWERLEPLQLAGTAVQHLAAEDLLLILCVHGAKHCWGRLEWICSVAELICRRPQLDWSDLLARARASGSERMVLLGLYLAHDLLQVALPDAVKFQLEMQPITKALAAQVCTRIFDESSVWPTSAETLRFRLALQERWQDKVRYGLDFALRPNRKDWVMLPLPGFLSFLYYPLRLIRLLGNFGFGQLKRHLLRSF